METETTEIQQPITTTDFYTTNTPVSYKNIAPALVKFQAACPIIHRNSDNPFANYTYADLATIVEAIKPHLAKADLAFIQIPYANDSHVGVTTILMHGGSGDSIESSLDVALEGNVNKKMTPIQGAGSIISYLRRYALSSILGLVTDDDTDGGIAPDSKAPAKAKPKPPPDNVAWLTETQFNKTLTGTAKQIKAVMKKYSTITHKMKKTYETQLNAALKKLSDE